MSDLATIEDMEAFLQWPIPAEQVASALRALNEASATVRGYTRQYLELVAEDVVTVYPAGAKIILLPELPVVSITSVVADGTALTTDQYREDYAGALVRTPRAPWPTADAAVTITYTHGYDPLPDTIVAITTRIATRAFQAGLRAAEGGGVAGIASKSLGDFSVSYAAEGAVEGVMGASAAYMLLRSEMRQLDRFRI